MRVGRWHFWDVVYAILLILAIPVAIFHIVEGRWVQAILATFAVGIGAAILFTGWLREQESGALERSRGATLRERLTDHEGFRDRPAHEPLPRRNGRLEDWAFLGAIAGFVGTGIMTAVLLLSYGIALLVGSDEPGANRIQVWFANLVDNTATDIALVSLPAALGIHLFAGIAWGIIYAGVFEPRLSGPGWRRGAIFSLVPWILSVTIFLPIVGGGFLGLAIDAGPLPVIGNLILHLAYGVAAGQVYASRWVLTEEGRAQTGYQKRALIVSQRTMAMSLVAGMILGLFVGLLGSSLFAPGVDVFLVGVIGAMIGGVVGVLVGSIAGLSPEQSESDRHEASAG
jgi:xanthosine utilization system XapX-like protein